MEANSCIIIILNSMMDDERVGDIDKQGVLAA